MNIELHLLQSFVPSNLNRDDTGNPKDTEFGGVRRARVSSQCLKRAIRSQELFKKTTEVELGVRTRWMSRLFVEAFSKAGKDAETAAKVADALATQYCKMDGKHSSVLVFLSGAEVARFSQSALERWEEISGKDGGKAAEEIGKAIFKELKERTSAPDIAMFGRMLAEKPELNIDAACQVAHGISTHRVNMEMDFYTAVDDLSLKEESGAGMMGVIPFNSACFYRYARVDWDQLVRNLNGDKALARKTVEGFLRASIAAIPTGKQNSFAALNLPDFLLGVARKDGQAWNLANAFEKPVRADREGGYVAPSIAALDGYWGRLARVYGSQGVTVAALALDESAPLEHLKAALCADREAWIGRLLAGLE